MAKSKEMSMKTKQFVKAGGSDGVPQQGAHPAQPGVTKTSNNGKTSFGVKGGTTKMFGKSGSSPVIAGQTSR